MLFSSWLRGAKRIRVRNRGRHVGACSFAELQVEQLEPRVVPYATTGNLWPHPELVTISFAPDGTNVDGMSSDLFSVMNAKFGSVTTWQNQILKAAQAWAQQTNLNFTVVSDNGGDSGSGSYQQGDPGFGDIRIFGYDFGDSTLAFAYLPPPTNNYSIAGDIAFNTAQTWNIGSTYDLATVAMHEVGHSLGLDHSTSAAAVMYSVYNGIDSGLNSDDISGIRNIYSADAPRSSDQYDAAASNETFSTATDVTSAIDPQLSTALVNNADITTIADVDYYKFTAPSGASRTLVTHVQSTGLSLLAPKAWIYDANFTQLATATYFGYQGSTLTLTATGIVAGQTYYVKVDGATNASIGTGAYAVTLNFNTNPDPTVPLPNTQTPNGNPLSGGGGLAVVDTFSDGERHRGPEHSPPNASADTEPDDEPTASKTLSDLCFLLPESALSGALEGVLG